jgi:hypothetical protein
MTNGLDDSAKSPAAAGCSRSKFSGKGLGWLGLWVVLSWVGAFVFEPVAYVLPIGLLAYFIMGRFRSMLALFVLSPLVPMFLFGMVTYWTGSARCFYMGLPSLESENPCRGSRAPQQCTGDLVVGCDLVWQVPNNLGVGLMGLVFGPMSGTYDGPYPTKDEAAAALAAGQSIQRKDIQANLIPLAQGNIKLDADVGPALLRGICDYSNSDLGLPAMPKPAYLAAVVKGRCLAVEILDELRTRRDQAPCGFIVLIDTNTGRPFAFYAVGEYHWRLHPASWQKN